MIIKNILQIFVFQTSLITIINGLNCSQSSYRLNIIEDKNAYKKMAHIYYQNNFKKEARMLKCHLSEIVKSVDLIKLNVYEDFELDACNSGKYIKKLTNPLFKSSFMIVIAVSDQLQKPCSAVNQLNLLQTPSRQWSAHIITSTSNIILPMANEWNGDGIKMALDTFFIATAYRLSDDTFKALGDDLTKLKATQTTIVIFLAYFMLAVAFLALIIIGPLAYLKKRRERQLREKEKSLQLKPMANDGIDGGSPVWVDDD